MEEVAKEIVIKSLFNRGVININLGNIADALTD